MAGRKQAETPALEWAAAALGALLALGLLGILAVDAFGGPGQSGAVVLVRAGEVRPSGRSWLVEVTAENPGDVTAAAVAIEGELKEGEQAVETSRATIDYVPAGGREHAALIFTRDPAAHRLELRATGFEEP